MTKIYSLILVFIASVSFTFSQNTLQIKKLNGEVVTGQTFVISGAPTEDVIHDDLRVVNTSGSTVPVKVKRYEVNVGQSTKNYFCWGVCLNEMNSGTNPVVTSPTNVNMLDGDSAMINIYHKPQGNSGVNTYLYVAYDENNVNDSVAVIVEFNVDASASVKELNYNNVQVSLYPNPATSFLNVNVSDVHTDIKIECVNIIGESVYSKVYNSGQKIRVDLSDFRPGTYFLSVADSNGKAIQTKRFIVRK